jgi:hypothetical protein
MQVNVEANSLPTDEWQPVIAVKPDGSAIFIAWYDRRNDPTNNSLIETWGVFANLPITNATSFSNNFRISATQFPPVFTGTTMTNAGTFDLAYPSKFRSDGIQCPTFDGAYAGHAGDYDTATASGEHVYFTWSDNRLITDSSTLARNQADIRLVRIPWPGAQ